MVLLYQNQSILQELSFQCTGADPPTIKESILRRFIFPKHGDTPEQFYAVESNPKTRAMYSRHGITAQPYDIFIKQAGGATVTPEPFSSSSRRRPWKSLP